MLKRLFPSRFEPDTSLRGLMRLRRGVRAFNPVAASRAYQITGLRDRGDQLAALTDMIEYAEAPTVILGHGNPWYEATLRHRTLTIRHRYNEAEAPHVHVFPSPPTIAVATRFVKDMLK